MPASCGGAMLDGRDCQSGPPPYAPHGRNHSPSHSARHAEQEPLYGTFNNTRPIVGPTKSLSLLPMLVCIIFAVGFAIGFFVNDTIYSNSYAARRREWAREREEQRQNARHELEQRKEVARQTLSWSDWQGSPRCLRHGAREYTAILSGGSSILDLAQECFNKPVDTHGGSLYPARCDKIDNGKVLGTWVVTNEPSCRTWWGYFDDKGCYTVGKRVGVLSETLVYVSANDPRDKHYEAVLENLLWGDDWREMCDTTLNTLPNGVYYESPTSCAQWGGRTHGMWITDDWNCH
ncbi:hypothetical protein NLJ89_g3632 [Agrocybe chaxingu]|uniref:Uncharacterized protein n=1 Tax=Agrocybe chaxingu TaxID=84603 RepID=A0A9W8K5B4_9AGAR|nr:hypothetical protein NLJ89_g3632 [Agrocybe chaxingu]